LFALAGCIVQDTGEVACIFMTGLAAIDSSQGQDIPGQRLLPSAEQYILFQSVRFFGAERGKTAHYKIIKYLAAAGEMVGGTGYRVSRAVKA
jgi:hypothetical protein